MWGVVLVIGGLWMVGRISRGFQSHPSNQSRRVRSPFSTPIQSELMDASAVSDDTAQEHGAFVVGEPDDYAPPDITAIEQTPAGINDSIKPSGSQCCGGAPAAPINRLPVPGRAPGARPIAAPARPIVKTAAPARSSLASRVPANSPLMRNPIFRSLFK